MPWKEVTTLSERIEFIQKALEFGSIMAELCRQYGISRKTGYKWLKRYFEAGPEGLVDQTRRPHGHPRHTSEAMETLVVWVRANYAGWGGRKIKGWLEQHEIMDIPSASTITQILRRNGVLDLSESRKHRPAKRFEMETPNVLWQMDYKGKVQTLEGRACYPLAVLDDASRFLLTLTACPNQTQTTIQNTMTKVFREVGLPERMLMDNGPSWSGTARKHDFTFLSIWLIRLGITISHGRAYHPQTQGKIERLNRSLDEEVLNHVTPGNEQHAQSLFDRWQYIYNYERPHEALGMKVPGSKYAPSPRPFPEVLPLIEYPSNAIIRKVDQSGRLSFRNCIFRIGKSFAYLPVQIVPTEVDGEFQVRFLHQPVAYLNFRCNNVK